MTNAAGSSSESHEPAARWWVAGSLLAALIAAAPLLIDPGFLNTRGGGDSPFLVFRLQQLTVALSQGVFPVRWMPDAAFGLGYPFFSYYAALPYYFAAIFRFIGFSYVFSLKLAHLTGFLTAGIGMFVWIRRITGRSEAGLLASVAYTFAPFHLVNVYVRGDSLAEFWAMAWFPLILLAIFEACLRPAPRRIALVALAFGALVMTHNVSALMFSPPVAAYALICLASTYREWRPLGRSTLWLVLGGLLGLALATWVWIPALAEQGYVQLDAQTTGFFFYANHFRGVDLVQPAILFSYDPGSSSTSPFSMGLVQAIFIGIGAAALIVRMIRQRAWWRDGFLLGGLTLATLMITPVSAPIWANIPLLPFVQFPWRFLSVQALFGAVAISALADVLMDFKLPQSMAQWLAIGAISIILGASSMGALRLNFITLYDADITPEHLQWYESFSGNIGTTIRYEYLPRAAVPRPYTSDVLLGRDPRALFLVGAGEAQRTQTRAASQEWSVNVTTPDARLAFPLLYWPGWEAKVDGRIVPIEAVSGLGYMRIDVPRGEHQIDFHLGHTATRWWAEAFSVIALLIVIVLLRPHLPVWNPRQWGFAAALIAGLIVLTVILHTLPPTEARAASLITADFSQEAYLHPSPDGVRYSDGAVLRSAVIEATDNPTLRWSTQPSDAILTLNPPPQQEDQGAPAILRDSPEARTPGLYFPRIHREDADALTSDGQNRSDLYLLPVVIPSSSAEPSGTPVNAAFGPVALLFVESQFTGNALDLLLWWQANSQAAQNYAIALRLIDQEGNERAALDTQAGSAGMYPTALWSPGERIPDHYRMPLPDGIPPGRYTLRVTLYEASTLTPIGSAQVEGIEATQITSQTCPDNAHMFSEEIGVASVSLPERVPQGDPLRIAADWIVADRPSQSVQARWEFVSGDEVAWQEITPLSAGSDPTLWNPAPGQCGLISALTMLHPPGSLIPGDYDLRVEFVAENGTMIGPAWNAGQITIAPRDRVFDVPPVAVPWEVTFGDQIKTWGYSVNLQEQTISLDMVWGAVTTPAPDYQYFVHLFDPQTEQIVAQIDSMPRAYTYPTTRWLPGEVVAETITLDLRGVPPGQYRLAIGWCDPTTLIRLNAVDASGSSLADDRAVLPEIVIIP